MDAASELLNFSTTYPEINPKRRKACGDLGPSPRRVDHIDLREQGTGLNAHLGTRPMPPPPRWGRTTSTDSVSTECMGASPPQIEVSEGSLFLRNERPPTAEDDEDAFPADHPAAVRARARSRPSPTSSSHHSTISPPNAQAPNATAPLTAFLVLQTGVSEDIAPRRAGAPPPSGGAAAVASNAPAPFTVSQMPKHDVRLVCDAAVQLACSGVATALLSVAEQAERQGGAGARGAARFRASVYAILRDESRHGRAAHRAPLTPTLTPTLT